MSDAVRRNLEAQPDAALLAIVIERAVDYTDEARAIAREVLAARGVDPEAAVAAADQRAADERTRANASALAVREARATRLAGFAAEAAAVGACVVCRARPVSREHVVGLARTERVTHVGPAELRSIATVELPVPVCERCYRERDPRLALDRVPRWIPLAMLTGAPLMSFAVLLVPVIRDLPGGWPLVAMAAPLVVSFGILGTHAVRVARRKRDLVRTHPAGPEILAAGFRPTLGPGDGGESPVEFWASQLEEYGGPLVAQAERVLQSLGGDAVVRQMVARLGKGHATEPALRVLVALRAHDSVPAIRPLLGDRRPAVHEAARAALAALGEAVPAVGDAPVPRAVAKIRK